MAVPDLRPDLWSIRPMQPVHIPVPEPKRPSRMALTAIPPALAVLVLGLIHIINGAFDLDLARYGLLPRTLKGLLGVLTAPLLHGDLEHLLNNAFSGFVLGWALFYFYPRIAGRVVVFGWLATGVLVWLVGRPDHHIGASGVVYTMAAFLFTSGIIRNQRTLMALALLVVFLYGSMVWGMFPLVPRISWESHLFGAIVGVVLAVVHRQVPPAVQDPVIVLDDPDDDDDTPPLEGTDPGDEVDERRLKWERELRKGTPRREDGAMTTTWDDLG